jgi:ABC-2 type transport system ATP-binding protein
MNPVLQLIDVTKRYGSTVALDRVSLAVPPGHVCALLGGNGAGKTTAIRTLLGYERPDSGVVTVLGMDPQRQPLEVRSRVGYVSDKPALYDWMTVKEIGWFTAGFYPTGFLDEFTRCVKRFGLEPKQKIKSLSKGGRAKVALALSLAHNPSLLILDEPTSGLDPLVRREFLESMIDLASEGRTVLISSHQVSEVERVADIVAILLNGRLVSFERLEDLKRSVREVSIATNSVGLVPVPVPGRILAHVPREDEHQYLVRDLDEAFLKAACADAGISAPKIRHPSLEDILLAMLRDQRQCDVPAIQHDPWTTPAVAAETTSLRV